MSTGKNEPDSPPSVPESSSLFSEINSSFCFIPNEILQIVFNYCCDVNRFKVAHPSKRVPDTSTSLRSKPALVVSSVNSRWRINGIAMPHIWSRVALEWYRWEGDDEFEPEEIENFFFPLTNFFSRSLQLPLSVNLRSEVQRAPPVLKKLLTSHMHRLQSFALYCPHSRLGHFFESLEFPQLTDLTLSEMCNSDITAVISAAPKLRKFSTDESISARYSDAQSFPYSHLSSLKILWPKRRDLKLLSGKAANLRSLILEEAIHGALTFQDLEDNLWPAYFPSVETLTIHPGLRISGDWSILPSLTVPCLTILSFEPLTYWSISTDLWPHFDHLLKFVERSSFSLTSLSMTNLAITDSNMVDLLSLLPTLINLTISDVDMGCRLSPITEHFIESLCVSQSVPLIPRLRSLRLYSSANVGFNDASVVEMVRSRWIPGARSADTHSSTAACLREFTLKFSNREKVSDVYELLDAFEREGLRAVVLWKNS